MTRTTVTRPTVTRPTSYGATVADHMTASPHTIGLSQTLEAARSAMAAHAIRHLPVLEGGQLRGILSSRDIALVEALPGLDPSELTVEEAMTAEPYSVAPQTALRDVVDRMRERKFGAVVVMDGARVTGIFTTIDALDALAARL